MIRVFETFTGYGGASWALRKAGVEFEVVGYSEIDKYAIKNFELNFPECAGKNFGDITKIDASLLPDFDFMSGGPPCQAFSLAGQRKGFDDVRGTLWFDFFRIAKEKKPKYMLIENVRGLDNHDNGKTLKVLLHCLSDLGYGVCYKNLNSKDFNTPQNRDRVWFVCKLGGWDFGEYRFPEKEKRTRCLKDVLEPVVAVGRVLPGRRRWVRRRTATREKPGCVPARCANCVAIPSADTARFRPGAP